MVCLGLFVLGKQSSIQGPGRSHLSMHPPSVTNAHDTRFDYALMQVRQHSLQARAYSSSLQDEKGSLLPDQALSLMPDRGRWGQHTGKHGLQAAGSCGGEGVGGPCPRTLLGSISAFAPEQVLCLIRGLWHADDCVVCGW